MKNILVTGGAGYIGAHVCETLIKNKKKVIVVDNLSTGFKKLLNKKTIFYKANILNLNKIRNIIITNKIDSVIHLAGSLIISVGEKYPKSYYRNNVLGTKTIIEACKNSTVKNFLFSSTAAVYKDHQKIVNKNSKIQPKSVYGKTKIKAEKLIIRNCQKSKISYAILRYFNVCGASPSGNIGLISKTDSLFKNISNSLMKKKPIIKIYGNNYDTSDGTAIRDYIHVSDLSDAHYKVLKKISKTKSSIIVNCGYNRGISVNAVAKEFIKQSKKEVKVLYEKRRPGDLAVVIADNNKLKKIVKWSPKYFKLSTIVKSCIKWEKRIHR